MATKQLDGNPVYSDLSTGQHTVTASATAVGTLAGIRLLWLVTPTGNAGAVYYGPSGVTTSTGVPIPAGDRRLIAIDSLANLFVVGTNNDVVAYEAYK